MRPDRVIVRMDCVWTDDRAPLVIALTDYPWFPNDVMEADPALLDRLIEGGSGSVERLLFGRVPLRAFGDALTAETSSLPLPGYRWVMHLSGYFGGVWLRREIASRSLRHRSWASTSRPTPTPSRELSNTKRPLTPRRRATTRKRSVRGRPSASQLDSYGYNHGYLIEILERPPAGLSSPDDFFVAPGLLDARYAIDEIAGLAELRDRFATAAAAGSDRRRHADRAAGGSPCSGPRGVEHGIERARLPTARVRATPRAERVLPAGHAGRRLAAVLASCGDDADLARPRGRARLPARALVDQLPHGSARRTTRSPAPEHPVTRARDLRRSPHIGLLCTLCDSTRGFACE